MLSILTKRCSMQKRIYIYKYTDWISEISTPSTRFSNAFVSTSAEELWLKKPTVSWNKRVSIDT